MTVLAYRYEGLRLADMRRVVRQLKTSFQAEAGPRAERPTFSLFESWVVTACRTAKVDRSVVDLEMFQLGDSRQVEALFVLLRSHPLVINYYLRQFVFKKTMWQQLRKITASGQELGGDLIFGRRLGFSGTPSDLLPFSLGRCQFETGSEGKILWSLTNKEVTTMSHLDLDGGATRQAYSVSRFLDAVASADPPYHALIDTGALVTGLSNEQVARYLIRSGLPAFKGVVFLDRTGKKRIGTNPMQHSAHRSDHNDSNCLAGRKMILMRDAAKAIPLSECGSSKEDRFTFFDQVCSAPYRHYDSFQLSFPLPHPVSSGSYDWHGYSSAHDRPCATHCIKGHDLP